MSRNLEAGLGELPAGLLPAGRLVVPQGGATAMYWLSDRPVQGAVWAALRAEHHRSGLWPVLLTGLEQEPARPWEAGQVTVDSRPREAAEAERLLAEWWSEYTEPDEDDEHDDDEDENQLDTEPFGRTWPGLGPALPLRADPDTVADAVARSSLDAGQRLGLVRVERSADCVAALGWAGPTNYIDDPGEVAAVLRSWEDRYGVRVVHVGFDTLDLSVAAPPETAEQSLRVAAEHHALCPDNVWQEYDTLKEYAERLVGAPRWSFWWD